MEDVRARGAAGADRLLPVQVPATMSASATNSRRCDSQAGPVPGGPGESPFIIASVAERRPRDDEEVPARHVGFSDGNASNFLIAYVRIRPYISDVKSIPAMIKEGRKTKQGLRDLNYYGPRRVKDADGAPPAAAVADGEAGPEAGPPAPPPDEAHDDGTSVK